MACCNGILSPAEFFDYGLYIPDCVYRKESDASSVMSSSHEDEDLTSEALREKERLAEIAAAEEEQRKLLEATKVPKSAIAKEFEAAGGGQKSIPVEKAVLIARKLGVAPSQVDIAELKASSGGSITQEALTQWVDDMKEKYIQDTEDALLQFFKHFDVNGSGTMSRAQIYNILGSFGEPLTRQEIDAILAEFGLAGDNINYEVFVHKLLEKPA